MDLRYEQILIVENQKRNVIIFAVIDFAFNRRELLKPDILG